MSDQKGHLFHKPFHAEAKNEDYYRDQKKKMTKESVKKTRTKTVKPKAKKK